MNSLPDVPFVMLHPADPVGTTIHSLSIPLGPDKWLNARYVKEDTGYRWQFDNGGMLMPDQWPEIIARGICGLPRFGNHLERKYTVGQHSYDLWRYLLTLKQYTPAAGMLALVHDAPEAFGVGDMNTHLKRAIGGAASRYEDDLVDYILQQVGVLKYVTDTDRALVHAADKVFGASEARKFGMRNAENWKVSSDNEIYLWVLRNVNPSQWDKDVEKWWSVAWVQTYNMFLTSAEIPF